MLNRVELIGKVRSKPYVTVNEYNKQVAIFSLATEERFVNPKTSKASKTTQWHQIVLWEPLSTMVHYYLKLGDNIYVCGKLRTKRYVEDGEKKCIAQIVADTLIPFRENITEQMMPDEIDGNTLDRSHISNTL